MKEFQELKIQGHETQLKTALTKIECQLRDGWSRDKKQESKIASAIPGEMYCFVCTDTQSREAANLWLAHLDSDSLYVSNIVPENVQDLNFDQYNEIIQEFYEKFVEPVANELNLQHMLTSDIAEIQDSVSPETVTKLQRFAKAANKSTGNSHPLDRTRWHDFLIAAHYDATPLKADALARWLEENEGWPEETAYELSINYENSRSLLRFYDEHRP